MVEAVPGSPRNGISCPWCGGKEEEAGGFCSVCGRVIVHVPSWAQAGRRRLFTGRRIAFTLSLLFLAGFVFWLNFPFFPDPVILLFKRPTTNLSSNSLSGQWSMHGRDLQQRRFVDSVPRQPVGQVLWSKDLGEPTRSTPVVVGGVVYIGGHFKITALEAATGRTLWEKETSGPVNSSLAVAADSLYISLLDHRLLALDLETGEVLWEFKSQDIITASPVVANGIVYIGSWDGSVYALDAANGSLIWQYETGGPVGSHPAIHDGAVFITDNNGNLFVLNARTGQERLMFRTPGPVTASPVVANGLVYFPSGGTLYAVDADTREIPGQYQLKQVWAQFWIWQVPGVPRPPGQQGGRWRISPEKTLSGFTSSPAIALEAFYMGDLRGNFYARDALHGRRLWRFRADAPIVSSPVIAGARVYFGTRGGTLYALDRNSGELVWQRFMGASVEVSPVFAAGRLYVHTGDGRLHSIR